MYYNFVKTDFEEYYNSIKECKLKEIINYSLEGGKCIRSFIIKHLINTLSDNTNNIWEPIVAIELVHGASLIIDDLPCMDNDVIRRKKPSTFVKFGERNAILTSLFAISEASKLILQGFTKVKHKQKKDIYENLCLKIITEYNELIGKNLIVGQILDLEEDISKLIGDSVKLNTNFNNNKNIIYLKTCSLFVCSFQLGGFFSGKEINLDDFKEMGNHFGIMFQLMDDFKDMDTDRKEINYVLKYGKIASEKLYLESKKQLLNLLEKNNIATNEFLELINIIDEKFDLN